MMRFIIILLLSVVTASCFQGRLNLAMDPIPYIPINGETRKKVGMECGEIVVGLNGPYNREYRYALELRFINFDGQIDINRIKIFLNDNRQSDLKVWMEGKEMKSFKFPIKGGSKYVIIPFGINVSEDVDEEKDEIYIQSESSIITSDKICDFGDIDVTVDLGKSR